MEETQASVKETLVSMEDQQEILSEADASSHESPTRDPDSRLEEALHEARLGWANLISDRAVGLESKA